MDSKLNPAGSLEEQVQDTFRSLGSVTPALLSKEDQMSDSGICINTGTINHIFDVLKTYEHPFILVGALAHRWMGCPGCCDEGFDMVLRNDQLKAVVADLIETGHWTLFDAHVERRIFKPDILHMKADVHDYERLPDYCCDADAVLERADSEDAEFGYLRLWSEDTYRINVDQCAVVEVPDLHSWNSFLVEE